MAGQGPRRAALRPDPVIEHRRARVAELQLFGWTLMRITLALADEGLINPVSRAPWSLDTIHKDMAALKAEWKARRHQAVELYMDMHLAKIERVQEESFKDRQWFAYLQALEKQAELLQFAAVRPPDSLTPADLQAARTLLAHQLNLLAEKAQSNGHHDTADDPLAGA